MPIKISGATSGSVTISAPPTGDDTNLSLPDTDDVSLASLDQIKIKNELINGNFDHWQRATSSATNGIKAADQWGCVGSLSSSTISRQAFTLAAAINPDNGQENEYYCKVVVTSNSGAAAYVIQYQQIEDIRRFAGKTMMLSFFASGNDTGAAVQMAAEIRLNYSDSSSDTASTVSKFTVGNGVWTEHNIEVVVPDMSGETIVDEESTLQVDFWFDAGSDYNARTDSLGHQDGDFYLSDVRFYESDYPNRCIRRSPEEELSLCQRYYYKCTTGAADGSYYGSIYTCNSTYTNTIKRFIHVPLPVEMYSAPTVTATIANGYLTGSYHIKNVVQLYCEANNYNIGVSAYDITCNSEM